MTKRTKQEQQVWDALVIELAAKCLEIGPQGCAHLLREIADSVLRERRESIREDR